MPPNSDNTLREKYHSRSALRLDLLSGCQDSCRRRERQTTASVSVVDRLAGRLRLLRTSAAAPVYSLFEVLLADEPVESHNFVSVAEQDDGGDAHDAVPGDGVGVGVDVYPVAGELARVGFSWLPSMIGKLLMGPPGDQVRRAAART